VSASTGAGLSGGVRRYNREKPREGLVATDVVGVQVLQRAAHIMGGASSLAHHLRISQRKLDDWLDQREPIPWEISVLAAEIVVPALLIELFARHKA
jgi:hypothetical protein